MPTNFSGSELKQNAVQQRWTGSTAMDLTHLLQCKVQDQRYDLTEGLSRRCIRIYILFIQFAQPTGSQLGFQSCSCICPLEYHSSTARAPQTDTPPKPGQHAADGNCLWGGLGSPRCTLVTAAIAPLGGRLVPVMRQMFLFPTS